MNPLLASGLLAAHHDALLDYGRGDGVHRSALALFAGGQSAAGGTLAAISLRKVSQLGCSR
jgi:hypothetical protein